MEENIIGRPTKYDPRYCDEIEEFMGQGFSQAAFAGKIGVNEDTIYEWKKVHPAFSEATKRGVAKSQLFWERLGLEGTTGVRDFNVVAWIFNMKNRFKWRDRQDITSDDKQFPTPIYGGTSTTVVSDS